MSRTDEGRAVEDLHDPAFSMLQAVVTLEAETGSQTQGPGGRFRRALRDGFAAILAKPGRARAALTPLR
jgi:hypothetical protein